MNKRLISLLIAAVCTTASVGSFAQGRPDDGPGARGPGGPGGGGQNQAAPNRGGPDRGGSDRAGPDRGGPDRGPGPGGDRGPDRHYAGGPQSQGPGPQRWDRGEQVPRDYRGREYVISDWRPHHLDAPPRGYQWIGVGADYFLIGIATGIVLQSVIAR